MASWGSYSSLYGPIMAFLGIGVLVLILRWAFARGTSVVERPTRPGTPEEYGLLNPVASPGSYIEAELLRQQLEAGHIRATVALTNDGPRVMVWPADEARARELLASR
jgi:hypothetical protein